MEVSVYSTVYWIINALVRTRMVCACVNLKRRDLKLKGLGLKEMGVGYYYT